MSRKVQVISRSADKRRAQIVIKEKDATGVWRSRTHHVSLNKNGDAELVRLNRKEDTAKVFDTVKVEVI